MARAVAGLASLAALADCASGRLLHRARISSSVTRNSSSVTQYPGATPPPKLYFLFLATDKISNLGVWQNFFSRAPAEQYEVFVHCKMPHCTSSLVGTKFEVVPTVPSYYCTDLVSPMNQLLSTALGKNGAGNPADKFIFVSDSTLPAKPFQAVYGKLAARQGSDFCIFPTQEWADVRNAGVVEVAPKHHQWIILSREHAQGSSSMWAAGKLHDFMARFRMNHLGYTWMNNTFADSRNFGCLDEFWHMAAIFGSIKQPIGSADQDVHLPNFVGGPLRVSARAGWQGTCDTFVMWSKYLGALAGATMDRSSFEKFHMSLDRASVPHGGNNQRPGWWDTISMHGIRAIRQSDFLFVRKFIDKPALADGNDFGLAYTQIVFT